MSLQLPVFLDWRSSNSYLFYHLDEHDASRIKQVYVINTGIDTLFSNGIRTRLELTNQDIRLDSRILIKEALVSWQSESFILETAMKDFGQGKGYFLFNRRNDDSLFDDYALFSYRWHGLQAGYTKGSNAFGAGLAGNDLNLFLAGANYEYRQENREFRLFGAYVHKDNHYTVAAFDAGSELSYYIDALSFRAGFNYHYLPESKHLPEMGNWHLLSEAKYSFSPQAALILSADLNKEHNDSEPDYLYEGCLDVSFGKLQSYAGARVQSVFSENAYTGFLDCNYFVREKLKLGIFCDYVIIPQGENYVKAGIQTSFMMD